MSHWRCCCTSDCCYVEDTFCRDDTGNNDPSQGVLGGLWEVLIGTWWIDGGYCGEVGYDYECEECKNNNPACTLRVTLGGIVVTDPEDCDDRHVKGIQQRVAAVYGAIAADAEQDNDKENYQSEKQSLLDFHTDAVQSSYSGGTAYIAEG